jgi:hypothetical protein
MNRFYKILMMAFSVAVLMSACAEDEDVNTPDKNREKQPPYFNYESGTDFWFPKEQGDTTIKVKDTNGAYNATIAEGGEWAKVSEISINSFKINYEENKKAENRTTKIILSLEGVDPVELVVSQRGPDIVFAVDSLALTSDTVLNALTMAAPYLGGNVVVPIRTNCNYNVDIETGSAWCSVADITIVGLTLNVLPNNGVEGRSTKVAVSHAYRDSTVRFEFVVTQLSSPVLLGAPEDEEVIEKENGFPYTFSWAKTGGIPAYTMEVSASSDFPEDATFVKTLGDVDSYVLQLSDIAEILGRYEAKARFYWRVKPTDPNINIPAETKTFYVLRKLVASYPLTLNGGDSSWTGLDYDDDGNFIMGLNGGRSSRRVFMAINPLTEAIPEGKIVATAYEYKTDMIASYPGDALEVYHPVDGWAWTGLIVSPCTEEWQSQIFSLRTLRSDWGAKGDKFYFFIMPHPVTSADQYPGSKFYFKDLRLEVYDE